MRAQLDAARERGEVVAVLWPSEDTIYGRFGYGMASQSAEIDAPRDRMEPYRDIESPGEMRHCALWRAPSLWSRRSMRMSRAKRRACSSAHPRGGRTGC